ncbi:uncharacterized protein LOC125748837 [Brienomyrus brachyistius]|uniref:uncharacterized protein LOC125748837 n=1 Tax=Brienomyrus brachyistius TaxID=42636 RepID=UPI0020B32F20|nr:uncharacterized protein LOC125748837 [Brienomyrus brachyistius]
MAPKKGASTEKKSGPQETMAIGGEEEDGIEPVMASVAEDSSLQQLQDMLRSHMVWQQARDVQWEQEAARQETRWKTLQHQFSLLQREVHVRTAPDPGVAANAAGGREPPERTSAMGRHPAPLVSAPQTSSQIRTQIEREPRLQRLGETDDVEHYLVTFERIAVACQWPTTDWAVRLAPLLTGKARAAYVSMDQDDALSYALLKEAILAKYDINQETYRLQFRGAEVGEEETPKELYVRLRDLYQRWVQPQHHTKEEIGETIILEQFLRLVSPELQVWIRERNPASASDAAALADVFVAARRKAQSWSCARWRRDRDSNRSISNRATRLSPPLMKISSGGKSVADRGGPVKQSPVLRTSGSKPLVCYQCGQEGHIKPKCPNNPANQSCICTVPGLSSPKKPVALHCHVVVLNGREVKALVDTGSMQSLVSSDLVPIQLRNYSVMTQLKCVHGEERMHPTARVYVQVFRQTYLLEVGVVDNLPYQMILGQDFPLLLDLVPGSGECNMTVTRAMAKKREEEVPLPVLPFQNADIEAQPGKSRKTKRQRRQEKFQFGAAQGQGEVCPEMLEVPLEIPPDMSLMQQQDADIGPLYQQAQAEQLSGNGGETSRQGFAIKNGVLFKVGGAEARMVVPQEVRGVVLDLGHSIPWAGHLGRQKTVSRVSRYFYWPNMAKDIAEFCKTCPECQKTASRCAPKVPLEPLPVVGTPFEQLGMDVVGPLERSRAGNRFMLVITDYATRYPEVFALKTVKARTVATCLVQLFSRVGFPRAIITDQGSNFMSKLLKQAYGLLGIKGIRTTPYHPQTDGLTERFNQTLKQMFCVDFRYLNSVSKFDSYPTPRIDDLIDSLGHANWRLMDQVLAGTNGYAAAYLDDIIVYSASWEDHVHHVKDVLGRIAAAGLTINPAKCAIAKREAEYLGYVIGGGIIKPQTDASDTGIGAVLLQGEPDQRHPVAYISRKLYPREVRYSTVEKECLAVKWALDTFRYYLLGREFLLETDHRPLQWMDRMRDSNARITRWYLSMQPYRFTINYIPGWSNATADFLSRLPA